jgi:ankyrin repeat protein
MDVSREFQAAVIAGDAATVAARLAEDPRLAAPCRGDGTDPVALAARHGRLEVLRLLLEAGGAAAPEGDPRAAPTALMRAAAAGAADAVALLLQYGADPALRDPAGRTAADIAEAAGHHDLARRLAPDAEAERIIR